MKRRRQSHRPTVRVLVFFLRATLGAERCFPAAQGRIPMMRKLIFGVLLLLPLLMVGFTTAQPVGATRMQATPTPPIPTPTGQPVDIPIYPGATLQQHYRTAFRGMTMDTWTYTVNGPKVTASDMITFYEHQMPSYGWTPMQPLPPPTATGTVMLTYRQQPMMGTPGPGPGHMQRMAMITIGTHTQANPAQIGVMIQEASPMMMGPPTGGAAR
jgi:hypothetical protein